MTSAPGGCDGCDDKEFIYRYDRCEVNTIYKDKYDFLSYQLNPLALETHECTVKNIILINVFVCTNGCVVNGAFICTDCLDGYRAISGICEKCLVESCLTCDSNKNLCDTCLEGYRL